MLTEEAHAYIISIYKTILRRSPESGELEYWVRFLLDGNTTEKVYYCFINCEEYAQKTRVTSAHHAGHYYSPVVDPSEVGEYVAREHAAGLEALRGISISLDKMEEFWRRSSALIADTPFQDLKSDRHRYFYDGIFSYGDAITLRAMMADLKPQTVVEIGSGFSSACMLDCADEFGLKTNFTFIDPDPGRLNQLLRPADHQRVTIIEKPVQQAGLNLYRSLTRGDILFIDSTHVLKTGSDVHYELFHILPNLQRGVVVHFHDIQYPFEYPDEWIFNINYSWNEIYALRAFLMFNADFKVKFWGSCFARERLEEVRKVNPLFLRNTGGSLWIERA